MLGQPGHVEPLQEVVGEHAPRLGQGLGVDLAAPAVEPREGLVGDGPGPGQAGVDHLERVAERPERLLDHALVLLGRERARRVDEGAAGLERLDPGPQQLGLLRPHLADLARAPVGRRLGVVGAEPALGRARGVDEDAVERLGLAAPVDGPVAEPREHVGGALGVDVGLELVEPRPHLLDGRDLALGPDHRRELAGLGPGRRAQVEHALAGPDAERDRGQLARHVLDVDVAVGVGPRGQQRRAPLGRDGVGAGDALDGLDRDPLVAEHAQRVVLVAEQGVHAEAGRRRLLERGEHGVVAVLGDDLLEAFDERGGERHGADGHERKPERSGPQDRQTGKRGRRRWAGRSLDHRRAGARALPATRAPASDWRRPSASGSSPCPGYSSPR